MVDDLAGGKGAGERLAAQSRAVPGLPVARAGKVQVAVWLRSPGRCPGYGFVVRLCSRLMVQVQAFVARLCSGLMVQ